MLLPALRQAREQGRKIVCVNNEKQSCYGISMYANDYGHYPQAYPALWNNKICVEGYLPMGNWNAIDGNYIPAKPPSAFICPTDFGLHVGNPTASPAWPDRWLYYGGYRGSYGPNTQVLRVYAPPNSGCLIPNLNIGKVTEPSQTIMLGEAATPRPATPIDQSYLNITWHGAFSSSSFRYIQRYGRRLCRHRRGPQAPGQVAQAPGHRRRRQPDRHLFQQDLPVTIQPKETP